MQAEDVVLSDVHIGCNSTDESGLSRTTFSFHHKSCKNEVEFDEDGDLLLNRSKDSVTVMHAMSTTLPDVGQQLWLGSLAMCDYILDNSNSFKNKTVLELGCGIGLTAIFMSRVSSFITCTDYSAEVLAICEHNLQNNNVNNATVKIIDWYNAIDDMKIAKLKYPDVIVACEVIYSNDLTEAFFNTLFIICTKPELFASVNNNTLIILLSIEKRINFTFSDVKESCKEYDYFQEQLNEFQYKLNSNKNVECIVKQINMASLNHFLIYERTSQLEIWTICIKFEKEH